MDSSSKFSEAKQMLNDLGNDLVGHMPRNASEKFDILRQQTGRILTLARKRKTRKEDLQAELVQWREEQQWQRDEHQRQHEVQQREYEEQRR